MNLNELDRVEILSLQDNYIEMTAMDDSEIVCRARNVRDGEIRNSIQAEHGFSAFVKMTREGRSKTLLFDFGFSEHGTAYNADALDVSLREVELLVLSHAHSDHTGVAENRAGSCDPLPLHGAKSDHADRADHAGAIHPEHVRDDADLPCLMRSRRHPAHSLHGKDWAARTCIRLQRRVRDQRENRRER
jgi:glyoxylase-like metal-dependent hydrolase (beta-lactamase superfamily II)